MQRLEDIIVVLLIALGMVLALIFCLILLPIDSLRQSAVEIGLSDEQKVLLRRLRAQILLDAELEEYYYPREEAVERCLRAGISHRRIRLAA
jgi:hypothetical protein